MIKKGLLTLASLLVILSAFFLGTSTDLINASKNFGSIAITPGFNYFATTTAGTYLIRTAPGTLHTLTINKAEAGAITLFDQAATSTVTGCMATSPKIATIKASTAEQTFTYDLALKNGLCITGAAATDITVTSNN